MQELKLKDDLFFDIINGHKKMTLRAGARDLQKGPLKFSGATDETLEVMVNVFKVSIKKLKDVTTIEALYEGASSVEKLRQGMLGYYPNLKLEDEVTLIFFKYSEN